VKCSQAHIPTLRDIPQEAESLSHQLMLRAGLIRRLASGIYSYLPLGKRSLRKLENIIREEMDLAGAQEVLLPFVQPRELWEESGRWQVYGKELGRFIDRHENEFCLQPTSEEVITDLARRDLKSYRQLPLNLYQIQTKFRDEIRPRFGVMRSREFLMKDAYSFDVSSESAFTSYEKMREAYRRIFNRTGLSFRAVEADSGAIGGSRSEEFMVLADTGESEIISCSNCEYAANQEKAISKVSQPEPSSSEPISELPTPGLRSIEDLAKKLECEASDLMKTMILVGASSEVVVVVLRGDHELNLIKLESLLKKEKGVSCLRLARDDEMKLWNLPKGSLGPYRFPVKHLLVVDEALSPKAPYVIGANRDDFHLRNFVMSRDLTGSLIQGLIRDVREGESCVHCGSPLRSSRGIEVGHVFYLGTKYSEAMSLKITHENGSERYVEMGCYGIGVGRTLAACIEQNHDQWGISWPVALAPYALAIISLGTGEVLNFSEKLYRYAQNLGVEVLWDDRDLSPGVKLKDMDLIGIPYQLIVGDRGLKNSQVEWKRRKTQEKTFVGIDAIEDWIANEKKNWRA
jgi:prolyl-tRNA synthetase